MFVHFLLAISYYAGQVLIAIVTVVTLVLIVDNPNDKELQGDVVKVILPLLVVFALMIWVPQHFFGYHP